MREDDLQSCVRGKYVLSLEVTNGLGGREFGFKVNEALWAKQYLQRMAPAEIETGLIFVRNENAINGRRSDLDFLGQIQNFKQIRSLGALESALTSQRIEGRAVDIIHAFDDSVRNGKPLNRLFYPSDQEMREFLQRFAGLGIEPDIRKYYAAISDVKGVVLEEYTRLFLKERIPSAEIISGQEYSKGERTIDIDHIVIGKKEEIKAALLNPKEIKAYRTIEKEPKERVYRPQFMPAH